MRIDNLIRRRIYRRLHKRERVRYRLSRRAFEMAFFFRVSNGLLMREHIEALGPAMWLFLWLIDRTTYEEQGPTGETWGHVLGGTEVTAERIAAASEMPLRKVREHLARLDRKGYIQTARGQHGVRIRVAKSKKFKRPDLQKTVNQPSDLQKTVNQGSDSQISVSRLTENRREIDRKPEIRLPENCQSQARMTVQSTLQGHDRDMRAGAREGPDTRISASRPDEPKGSETPCTESERAARARGRALLPAGWARKREET